MNANSYTKLDADQSAALLAAKIRAREPFFFLRYGDGALECMSQAFGSTGLGSGRTCDGELYSRALAEMLLTQWCSIYRSPLACIGDWLSASFDAKTRPTRYESEYRELVGTATPTWLQFEALLLMRESRELVNFYRAVKEDGRRKLFMGPIGNAGAAKLLGAEFIETPMSGLLAATGALSDELITREFDVLLYGCGMAGNIPAVRCWKRHQDRTYVNLGSAMDPLFRGRSRQQQIAPARARALFKELM
jgi:hypothetical protein